jgi:hypothetical protein
MVQELVTVPVVAVVVAGCYDVVARLVLMVTKTMPLLLSEQ